MHSLVHDSSQRSSSAARSAPALVPSATTDGPKPNKPNALVALEALQRGSFSGAILATYYRKFGLWRLALYALLLVCMVTAIVFCDVLLNAWSAEVRGRSRNESSTAEEEEASQAEGVATDKQLMGGYISMSLAQALCMVLSSLTMIISSVIASKSLHHDVAQRISRAPMAWFDATPSGPVLSWIRPKGTQIRLLAAPMV